MAVRLGLGRRCSVGSQRKHYGTEELGVQFEQHREPRGGNTVWRNGVPVRLHSVRDGAEPGAVAAAYNGFANSHANGRANH